MGLSRWMPGGWDQHERALTERLVIGHECAPGNSAPGDDRQVAPNHRDDTDDDERLELEVAITLRTASALTVRPAGARREGKVASSGSK